MDFTDALTELKEIDNTNDSEGVALLDSLQQEEQAEQAEQEKAKFDSAYQASDLGATGPMDEGFDYESEFKGGNSFTADENGGINLSNTNIRPATAEIAGRDVVTGKKFSNAYTDYEGHIDDGLLEIQSSNTNTKTGSPHKDMASLAKIAYGIHQEEGTYDDFVLGTQGNWTDQQRAVAWNGMQKAKIDIQDTKNLGARNLKENVGVEYVRGEGVIDDIDETELRSSAIWVQSGRNIIDHFNPEGSVAMTEDEVHESNLSMMSMFNWNIPMMMFLTNEVVASGDQELAKSFLYLMDQNDATNVSMDSVSRGIGAVAGDITTYMTVGGSILVSRLAAASMKAGVRKAISKIASVTAADAAAGGTMAAVDETSRQTIEGAAGEREELDIGQVGKVAAAGAAVSTVLGTGIATASDPLLRKYGLKTMKGAIESFKKPPPPSSAMPISPASYTPSPVEFKSELKREIQGMKGENVSVKKLRNRIKTWIGEGKIKKEEVDWSGLNTLESGNNISKHEALTMIGQRRPIPTLTPVAKPRFSKLTLHEYTQGYREYVINIDKTGPFQGPMGHFGGSGTTLDRQANVGHIRMSHVYHDGERGTMFLEGQSDIRTWKRYETQSFSATGDVVKEEATDRAFRAANTKAFKAKEKYDNYVLSMAERYKVPPTDPDAMERIWYTARGNVDLDVIDEMSKLRNVSEDAVIEIKELLAKEQNITNRQVPFTPFRSKKSSNNLLFRSAIMDAMNNNSKFMSWPKSFEQVAKIEGWDRSYLGQSHQDAANFMTKDMKKIAESYGFKVEEFMPDEFKNKVVKKELPINMPELERWVKDLGYEIKYHPIDEIVYLSDPLDANFSADFDSVELREFLIDAGADIKTHEIIKIDSKFYRIKISPEMRHKWGEEGAGMYSFGAPVGIGAAAGGKKQERDKDGKFK